MRITVFAKYLRVIPLLVLILYAVPAQSSKDSSFEYFKGQLGYFKELTLGQYANNNDKKLIKWVSGINIYVKGDITDPLSGELDSLIDEINQILGNAKLKRVAAEDQANFLFITDSTKTDYLNFKPSEALVYKERFGNFLMIPNSVPERAAAGFLIYANADSEIFYGSMYMDLKLFGSSEYRPYAPHFFRQMLTQSLGIPYKSRKYGDSIFSNHPSLDYVTRYSDLDRMIIKNLYDACVEAGMDKFELDQVILNGC